MQIKKKVLNQIMKGHPRGEGITGAYSSQVGEGINGVYSSQTEEEIDSVLSLHERIAQQLDHLQEAGLYRKRTDLSMKTADLLGFCSNDYLSLSNEPALKEAYQEGFERYPCGSGGSAVISGYHPTHQALEQAVASALGVDEALLFPSGFAANLAIMALLASLNTPLLIDKQVHASVYDGLKLADAKYRRYRHQDLEHLELELSRAPENALVVTEGLFSMSGQIAPLAAISEICHRYKALSIVDEAHSFGVLGPQGLGQVKFCGLNQEAVPLRLISFGKALAGQGALVAGKRQWISALLQHARSYIYSTAISPALAYGMRKAFELVLKADDRRQQLHDLIEYFQEKCSHSSLPWRVSSSPIQQLQLGCPHAATQASEKLLKAGIFCQAIRQPTVTLQETGLRVVLNAGHTLEDIDSLFKALV